jgi:SAM-dependent methyltransferase
VLGVRTGETVCDLMCDGASLGLAMGGVVGAGGAVVLVDTDAAILGDAQHDVAATGCAVSTVLASGRAAPLLDASCDRVASLCTFGFWDGDALLDVARRALRPSGSAAVMTWDAGTPLHERALVDALHGVLGMTSPFLTRCLAHPDPQHAEGWEAVAVHDVVRFDGIAMYWAAMVTERPLAVELAQQPSDAVQALRAACQRALEPCTAADGTMRIPVRATLRYRAASVGAG